MASIRTATPRDARAIAEVHVASWRWAYRDELPEDSLDELDVDERERMWSGWLKEVDPTAETLVAEDQGEVVGFCGYGASRDDHAPAGTGEVYTLYVLEDMAGHGVGRELFARANERLHALGYRRATLWVLAANERTRRFYEAARWSTDGAEGVHHIGGDTLPIVRYSIDLPPER
jgi:GNAT superfamily N-acetyltransferase